MKTALNEKNQVSGSWRFARSSGRVGSFIRQPKRTPSASLHESHDTAEILSICSRLFDLQDRDESELKRAISYSLKLWGKQKAQKSALHS